MLAECHISDSVSSKTEIRANLPRHRGQTFSISFTARGSPSPCSLHRASFVSPLAGCLCCSPTHCLPFSRLSFPRLTEPHPSFLTVLICGAGEEKIVGSAGLGLDVQISQPQNESLPLRDHDGPFTHSMIGISPRIILRCHRAAVLRGHYVPTAITW